MWNREGKVWYSEEEYNKLKEEYNKLKEELNKLKKMNSGKVRDERVEDEAWEAMNYQW